VSHTIGVQEFPFDLKLALTATVFKPREIQSYQFSKWIGLGNMLGHQIPRISAANYTVGITAAITPTHIDL
jgi:hypothetical protein